MNPTDGLWAKRNTPSMPAGAKIPPLTSRLLRRLARLDAKADARGE